MSSSLSNLAENLLEGLHSDKCTYCIPFLDYMTTKDEQVIFKCFECKKNYEKDFNKELIKRFANIYQFCNGDINKFVLLLRKGVYPYEYIDSWETFDEASLPDKEAFYSSLNMEDITNVNHRHAKRVFKSLNNKNLGDYHDLYVKSYTLLLVNVLENFRNMFIKLYKVDPAHILSVPKLAWQACLKKTGVKLKLLTHLNMLMMVEKGISGGIYQVKHRCAKANNKYMKNYDENKESSFPEYLDANNLHGWAISEPLPVTEFDWMEDLSKIDEGSDKGYIFDVDIDYTGGLLHLHSDLPFLPERMKVKKCNKLVCNLYDKKTDE